MDAGNGQLQRNLLIGLERQIGQVERLAVDEVPELLLTGQGPRQDRYALIAQQPLVALEGLPLRPVLLGVTGHLEGDRLQRQRMGGVEQDQHQIRDAFESIETSGRSHRGEPTAAAAP